jgi:hypothetical protein
MNADKMDLKKLRSENSAGARKAQIECYFAALLGADKRGLDGSELLL